MAARTVLITGGSRGIGRAIAQHYCDHAYRVVAPSRQELDLHRAIPLLLFLQYPPTV